MNIEQDMYCADFIHTHIHFPHFHECISVCQNLLA